MRKATGGNSGLGVASETVKQKEGSQYSKNKIRIATTSPEKNNWYKSFQKKKHYANIPYEAILDKRLSDPAFRFLVFLCTMIDTKTGLIWEFGKKGKLITFLGLCRAYNNINKGYAARLLNTIIEAGWMEKHQEAPDKPLKLKVKWSESYYELKEKGELRKIGNKAKAKETSTPAFKDQKALNGKRYPEHVARELAICEIAPSGSGISQEIWAKTDPLDREYILITGKPVYNPAEVYQ